MSFFLMSQKEIDRSDVIKRLIRSEFNGTEAARLLKLSTRQARRLKTKVRESGVKALIHGNRGKPSGRKIPEAERQMIVALLKRKYSDFKPTLAQEKLKEKDKIQRDPKTIRKIMIEERLWKSKKKKGGSTHRAWRQRKRNYGEMEQFDGSYHDWFEERGPKCCLLGSIDDASSVVTKLKFAEHEGVVPVFTFWKEYIEEHGKPRSIYLDKFSTYKMNPRFAEKNHELKTQFERAMEEVGVEPITAHSAEAKGRIERLFETLQDRLIKEMRLEGISTIKEANRFLEEEFLPKFNARYSVEPEGKANLHRKLQKTELQKLDSIFSRQYDRIIQNDFTLSFEKQWYQIKKDQPVTVCQKDKVFVEKRLDGSVQIRLRGKYLNYQILPERPKKAREITQIYTATRQGIHEAKRIANKPSHDHPWRKYPIKFSSTKYAY